jgi:L-iditol 2-dehydrogenase
MKAAVYEGVGKLSVKEIDRPKLTDDNIIIKVLSCAVCGTDIKAYSKGISRITIPNVLGHEFAGRIVEKGKNVEGFKVGDRITMATTISCGHCEFCTAGFGNLCEKVQPVGTILPGAYSEFMEVPAIGIKRGNVLKIPESLSDDEAAVSEPLGCVVNGQMIADVRQADAVAIVGAGPIGCLHIEVAKHRGATKILIAEVSDARLKLAEQFGVDLAINSSKEDLVSAVMRFTGGAGVDVVIVAAPSKEAYEKSLAIARKNGRISLFASLPKDNPVITIDGNLLHYRQIRMCGASDSTAYHQRIALDMLAAGKVNTRALITHRFSLDDILKAIKMLQGGDGLKAIIKP